LPEGAVAATVGALLADATRALSTAGCGTPRLDAELLLAEVLGVPRTRLVIDGRSAVDPGAVARFEELVLRRAAREPVAYISGRREFRRISLMVDPRVLIPRPETELLVEVGLTVSAGGRVVDVGTGSGAVALALKDERPDLSVLGTDLDVEALAVARANGAALGLDVQFAQADLLAGLGAAAERFDAVLANLPYVAEGAELQPEIASYEPHAAVFAGADGLQAIRRLIAMLDRVALVALEVGHDQASAVGAMLAQVGYTSVERLPDLAGHERVVVGRR
jgi:release factor glutamine methyltransferase